MKWVDLGRTTTRYELVGDTGPLMVLVHEMGGSLESWDGVVDRLRDDFRLLRYDFRGHGQAEKIGGPITFDDFAADLEALLDHLGVAEPFLLVGCAVGAGIAIAYSTRNPDRTSGLVIINPAIGIPEEHRDARRKRVEEIVTNGMRWAVPGSLDTGYPPVVRTDVAAWETFRARWISNDPVSLGHTFRMLIERGVEDRLDRIACPVLAVSGEHDKVRSPEYVKGVAARIANARVATVASGHHLPTQSPERLADLCREFHAGLPAVKQ